MKKTLTIALATAVLALPACTASSGLRTTATEAPSAATIIEKHVDATGGRAAHEAIRNRVTRGRAEIRGFPQHDWTASFVRYEAEPNLWSETLSFSDWENREGTDGAIGWGCGHLKYPQYPDRLKEPGEVDDLTHLTVFNGLLSWQDRYDTPHPVARRTVEGRDCHEVVLVPREGEPVTCWFDVDTHLLVRTVAKVGDTIIETLPSDYRAVDGVMIPHAVRRLMSGGGPGPGIPFLRPVARKQDLVMVVESVHHNVGDHHAGFEPPLAIRELMQSEVERSAAVGE